MLGDLGVTEKIIPLGLVSSAYRFHDRVSHSVIAEFDLELMKDEYRYPFVLQYEQYKLTASIAAEYANAADFDVRFSHALTGLTETSDGIEVEVTSPSGKDKLRADYVIGCDGGRSTVRKLAGIEFEGFTYPERFIKIATSFDFGKANSKVAFRNYFSDPNEWCNLFKVRGKRPPGLWRAIFPIGSDESDEAALAPERIEARLQKFFPNSGGRYEIEYVNVYGAHQCVAETFRKGRVLLAGDSAHVNNPIGGMGMNGGIHDGINLADKLALVVHGEAPDELLDLYSRQRRHAAVKYVQAQTIANKRLMEEHDPAVRRKNFDELRRIAENAETARAYMRRAALTDSLKDAAAVT
jgi:3-(3-hydroxy-phenyl)propionate hydroxylase